MLVPRIDIPQRRQQLCEKLIARPARLAQRRFAQQIGLRFDDLLRRDFAARHGIASNQHEQMSKCAARALIASPADGDERCR